VLEQCFLKQADPEEVKVATAFLSLTTFRTDKICGWERVSKVTLSSVINVREADRCATPTERLFTETFKGQPVDMVPQSK
jgi:hypothetical protein